MQDYNICKLSDVIDFNPKEKLSKGSLAKKVSMDKLQPYTKVVSSFDIAKYNGGAKFRNGDTIMARITPCLENGKTSFVDFLDDDEVAFGSTEFVVMRAKEGVTDSQYIYYLATSPEFRKVAIQSMVGSSGRQRVQQGVLNEYEIALPPLEEQKRIAAILSALDDKIEINRKINENLEQQAQALFKSWFVDFEPWGGKMPEDWRIVKLGEVCRCELGGTPSRNKPEYWSGDIPWINSGSVNLFRIIKPTEKITELGLRKSATKLLPAKTTVVAITGATLGQVSLLEIESCANQSVVGIIPNDDVPYEYLYPFINNNIQELISHKTGGAQQHINKQNIESLSFLLPTANVLKKYIDWVGDIYEMIPNNCFESEGILEIRNSLLSKLMSGEIDVSNIDI